MKDLELALRALKNEKAKKTGIPDDLMEILKQKAGDADKVEVEFEKKDPEEEDEEESMGADVSPGVKEEDASKMEGDLVSDLSDYDKESLMAKKPGSLKEAMQRSILAKMKK